MIYLGWMADRGGGVKKLKNSSQTKKTKKYLNDIFIYLEDPFFKGENHYSKSEIFTCSKFSK